MRQANRFVLAAMLLAGCASFPQLDAVVTEEAKQAPYPSIIPANELLSLRDSGRLTEEDGTVLLQRAARLRQRGRILRNLSVIDEATRIRISSTLRRLGG